MSDMSSLSHEYASTTDFSHHVNQAVLTLKKQYLGGGKGVDANDFADASRLVHGMVRRLLQRLGALVEPSQSQGLTSIPEDVLTRLEEKQSGNMEYFLEDLVKLEESLSESSDLCASEINLLDTICEVADASASATFRKLWRR
ncbi:hypothetical protein V6x_54630 [Gimesia chilikensis]|uniref:Uncharacterized protein n=1 Tax=Gimesia chilikensis TaxID=2605989 RepID=A0A517WKD8_9PLAN|nr:hypothetical protein [Gimesia chilikensis]QDU05722.1 hypothetical protein V6x_54630 [Gimesia chilikensis]